VDYARRLALSYNNVGLQLGKMGQSDAALELLRKAADLQSHLAFTTGETPELNSDVAATQSNLGVVLGNNGDRSGAAKHFAEAIELQLEALRRSPHDPLAMRDLAAGLSNLGAQQQQQGKVAAAADSFHKAMDLRQRLLATAPLNQTYQAEMAGALNNYGSAEKHYLSAIEFQERLVAASPQSMQHVRDLAVSYNNLGRVQAQLPDGRQAAEESFNKALQRQLKAIETEPHDVATLSHLGGVYNNLAMLQDAAGRPAEADANFKSAIQRQREALDRAGDHQLIRQLLSKHYYNYAESLANRGEFAAAREAALERRELWPSDSAMLLSAAEQLATLSQRARNGGVKKKIQSREAETAAAAAVETLQIAIAAGLESSRLNSPAFASLTMRNDFQALRHTASVADQPTEDLAGK
jgi:tetratricopeptide (TPR) repeat protein